MRPAWSSAHGRIYRARAEDVYPLLEPGSVTLVHSDGPYAMQKAEWDRMKVADLPAWYAPHIEAWGSLCAPSASVYLWNTAQGWAAIHPVMERAGWELASVIVWDKLRSNAQLGQAQMSAFVDVIEVCAFYRRGDPPFTHPDCTNVWQMHNTGYRDERLLAGVKVANPARPGSQEDRALHPCQKPLKFADRIVRASSRPGELILEPFGGTCRVAVACEAIAKHRPADARRYVAIEMDADGKDYIGAVIRHMERDRMQTGLFEQFPISR